MEGDRTHPGGLSEKESVDLEKLVERILSAARAKAPSATVTGVYEDEPILQTGACYARARQKRAEQAGRSQADYVSRADSPEEGRWRSLMAYGTVEPSAAENLADGGLARRAEAGATERKRSRFAPTESNGEGGHVFGASGSVEPRARSGREEAPSRSERFSRKTTAGNAVGEMPEWRRPARQASLLDFGLDKAENAPDFRAEHFLEPPKPTVELPPLLQKLRDMERTDAAFLKTRDWLFVHQAKLAVDYEDDYVYAGTFQHYFPTYQAMTDEQLRGYFSWRTSVRHGEVHKTSLSFAFVHLYELLNGVGAESPEDGFARLKGFWAAYRKVDARIDRYARTWLHDYVVFHGLDARLFDLGADANGGGGQVADAEARQAIPAEAGALCVLLESDGRTPEGGARAVAATDDARLFEALCTMGSYRLRSSAFFKEEPELTRRAACEVWRELCSFCRKYRKRSLTEALFGKRTSMPYPMFRSTVFYGETCHADAVYEVSPVLRYVCRNGRWTEECYHFAEPNNRDLGRAMKEVDRALRRRFGCARQLKPDPKPLPKYLREIVDAVVEQLWEERLRDWAERARRERRLDIDLSKLQGIRAAAAVTREALLVDEEREEAPADAPAEPSAGSGAADLAALPAGLAPEGFVTPALAASGGSAPESLAALGPAPLSVPSESHAVSGFAASDASKPENSAGLSPAELSYVRCLACGASPEERAAVLRQAGVMESLMVDAVNEKLFDLLGDVAIEDAGDGPVLIEDYAEDVKGYAGL